MRLVFVVLVLFTGCVPLTQYQHLERTYSAALFERNQMTKDLAVCEYQNQKLKQSLNLAPSKPAINKAELEEFKKMALEEAEKKFKARIKESK